MKKHMDKIISWILLIVWMTFIFYMSNMPGEVSTEQSDIIVELIEKLGLNINGEVISFLVRKAAHITEYMILFFLIYRVVRIYINISKSKIVSIAVLFIYAAADEIHQRFVPGREGCIRDVFIDCIGGIIGILILILINSYNVKRKNKEESLCQ